VVDVALQYIVYRCSPREFPHCVPVLGHYNVMKHTGMLPSQRVREAKTEDAGPARRSSRVAKIAPDAALAGG
jgi:hypothetical protein